MAPSSPVTGTAWADPSAAEISALVAATRREGWRSALAQFSSTAPFFVHRMKNLGLGNWHLLLQRDRSDRSLDVGSGFGSLPLGLSQYYRNAIGTEFLPERVAFSTLRAREEGRTGCRFVRSSGFALPFGSGTFGLVTMNGVLEWAGLYQQGNPRRLQIRMLHEAQRVLRPGGHVAVAIENRFALESLLGLPDTHTGLIGVTALPRWAANALMRVRKREPYRTYLYNPEGYRRLFLDSGFQRVRVFDLVSSYNDYDYVLDTQDTVSYRFLFQQNRVRPFFGLAGRTRKLVGRAWPGLLGELSYAYLVIGGQSVRTILDADHELWRLIASTGADPGKYRFACQGVEAGQLAVVSHDGERVSGMVELNARSEEPSTQPSVLPPRVNSAIAAGLRRAGTIESHGLKIRVHRRQDS